MDRSSTIGFALIAGIILTWMIFFTETPQPTPATASASQADSTQKASQGTDAVVRPDSLAFIPVGMTDSAYKALSDSAKQALAQAEKNKKYGSFTPLMSGTDRRIIVKTEKYTVGISTKGAQIRELFLNEFRTHDSLPLPLIRDEEGNRFFIGFKQADLNVESPMVESDQLHFEYMGQDTLVEVKGENTQTLVFRAKIDDRRYFDFAYTFKGNAYDYGFELKQQGMDRVIDRQDVRVQWETFIPKTEASMEKMREKTAIYYRSSESVEWMNPRSENGEINSEAVAVDWVAFHSQFFTHTLMTPAEGQNLENLGMMQADPVGPDRSNPFSGYKAKYMKMYFSSNFAQDPTGSQAYQFYAGPLDFEALQGYGRTMHQQIELGWGPLKWINRYLVIPVFNWLEGTVPSYGIIILILAILIKIVLAPLSYRTQISTTKMRVVNNLQEVKDLDERLKNDPTKLQQEKMGIYRKYGVSLFGGCWPMLLSYPFLIAFFFFFPNAIELRQQSFLWATDLSTYDSILDLGFNIPFYGDHVSLFTLLMTISIYAFTFISQQNQAQMNTNPVLKWMPYVMPIFFLGFLNSYSAGLSWYYLISNVLSISQTLITKRFINEDDLLKQMQQNAKAKAAAGKGKSRLERWAEAQQQRQREMQRNKSRGGK
jgi:YidC/Oxa1 family membrane protein insertase